MRVTTLTITEKLYDSRLLVPTHAEAQIELKVLTAPELEFVDGPLGTLARAAANVHHRSARGTRYRQPRQQHRIDRRHAAGLIRRRRSADVRIEQPLRQTRNLHRHLANGRLPLQRACPCRLNSSPSPATTPSRQDDRLDLMAARYLTDATLFWQLCDANNSPSAASLVARPLIGIPQGGQK